MTTAATGLSQFNLYLDRDEKGLTVTPLTSEGSKWDCELKINDETTHFADNYMINGFCELSRRG
jgi:hypothetical protein